MNKIFKVVWSKTKECYVVVSEVAKNNGGKKKVLASVLAGLAMVGAGAQVDAVSYGEGGGAANGNGSIAIGGGYSANGYGGPVADGLFNIAIGHSAKASDTSTTAGGNGTAGGAVAIGRASSATGGAAVALGNQAQANFESSTAIGPGAITSAAKAVAFGHEAKADKSYATAIGAGAESHGVESQAVGREAHTNGTRSIAVGTKSEATQNYAAAIGTEASATDESAIAIGFKAAASGAQAIATGSNATATKIGSIAMGKNVAASGDYSTAIGNKAKASGANSIAFGSSIDNTTTGTVASGDNSIAIGMKSTASGDGAVAHGVGSQSTGSHSVAVGRLSKAKGAESLALGDEAEATVDKSVAVGYKANATIVNGVALGSESKTTVDAGQVGYNPAAGRTNKYDNLTNNTDNVLTSNRAAVAIGDDDAHITRQLTGLAAGKKDTDAVNVAQLRAVNLKYAGNSGNSDVRLENGTLNIKGEGLLSTSADATGITVKLTKGDDIAKDNGKAKEPTNNGVATTQNVVQAINNSYWKATAGGNTDGTPAVGNVKPGTQVTYSAGDNLKVKQTINNTTGDQEYKYSLNPVLTGITSIANTTTGPKMTFGSNSINITGGSLDMGTNKITNLAPGTADNDAVNVKQLKDTELHITPGTYTPDANKKVKLTYTDGNNAVVTGKEAVIDLSGLATGGTASTEKVKKAANGANDTNIAEVNPKTGDTFGGAGATYEVSVSRNAVKDAAREAVTVNNGGTTTGGTYTADTNNPISVTAKPDNTNHNTTYEVTFDGNKAAKQIPLTYKATNGTTTTADQTVKLDKGLNFTGGDYTTASVGADGKVTFDVNLGTAPTVTDGKPGVPGQAGATGKDGIATVKTVVDTINNSGWKANAKANGGKLDGSSTATVVKPGDQVNFAAGKNLTVKQDLTGEHTYTYSLNKDLKDLTSVEIGGSTIKTDGDHITITSPDTNPGATPGATVTNKVANLGDEKHIKPDNYAVANDGSVTLKYVDGNGKDLTETTKITGIAKKAKVINGKNTTVEEGTDTTDNSVTYKVNVKGDLADISSITNGTGSGKISFEGDQVVKVGGDHPISFDGKGGYVTGLQNKDWDITNPTVVSGRAATEDQLKKVSDGFNNTVKLTGNSGATGTQKLNQNGGLSFGVVGADNGKYITTTASGSNVVADLSTDAKAKLNSKVVVAGSGAATVGTPTVTTNPDGSTVTTYTVHVDPATATAASTESVVKKAVTGDTNIADVSVADGKATGDVGAKYEVSVSRNAVKDAAREAVTVNNGGTTKADGSYTADSNNPISVTPTKDDNNHNTSYAVTFDGNKAAKQIPLTYKATNGTTTTADQTVKLDKGLNFTGGDYTTASVGADGKVTFDVNLGTAPTVTDGKPGVPGQAGATGKDGIATVKTVVDTINNSGWKANAKANGGNLDGSATATVVKPGNTVNYAAGKNLIVKQELETDGAGALTGNQTYTYSLNKDIDVESVHVGKDGKDGKIGIDGKNGVDGLDGTNRVDIHVEKGAKGVDGTDGHDGVNGHNGKDGMTRIVYEDKGGKQEVATLNDGLNFTGNNESKTNVQKLNSKVKVQGEGVTENTTSHKLEVNGEEFKSATGNIAVVADGHDTLTVKLNEKLKGLDSVQTKTVELGDHTTPGGTTNITYNSGDKRIEYTTPGTTDTKKVATTDDIWTIQGNGTDVKPVNGKVNVKAGENVVITTPTTADGSMTINAVSPVVYTTPAGDKLTKKSDGKFYKADGSEYTDGDIIASFENPNANSIPAGKLNTTDGGMIVNNIGSAIKTQNPTMPAGQTATYLDKLKAAADDTKTQNAAVNVSDLHNTAEALKANELHIRPTASNRAGETVNKNAAGTADEIYKYDATTKSVTLKYNDGTGAGVTGTEAKIDLSDLANQITSGYTFKTNATENGGKVVNDAATPAAETAVANGGVVNYAAGKNLTVKQDIEKDGTGAATGKQTYTYALADEIGIGEKGQPGVAGKDGVDGKIGVNGKDGSSVVINGKDGSIGMTGPQGQNGKDGINGRDGANISMTSAKGEQVLVNRDPVHSADTDKAERIVYVPKDANGDPIKGADGKNIVREVATMDDGMKYAGDDAQGTDKSKVIAKKLNKTLDIIGGADKDKLTDNNIGVNNDGNGKLKVQLSKEITGLTSVQIGGNTIKTDGDHITITSPDTTSGATPGSTVTNKVANLDDEMHIKDTEYTVGSDKKVRLTYVDGNGNPVDNKTAVIDLSGLPVGDKDTDMRIAEGTYTAKNGTVTLKTVNKDGTAANKDVVIKGINTDQYKAGDNVTFTQDGTDANGNPIYKINADLSGASSTESVVKKSLTGDTNIAEISVADGKNTGDKNAKYEVSVSKNAVKDAAREAVEVTGSGVIKVNADNTTTPHKTTYDVAYDPDKAAEVTKISYKSSTSPDAGSQGPKKVSLKDGFDFKSTGGNVKITTDNAGGIDFNVDLSGIHGVSQNIAVGGNVDPTSLTGTDTVTKGTRFDAGNNLVVKRTALNDTGLDHAISYELNKDLQGINSIRNANNGPVMNFNAGDIAISGGNLSMGDGTHNNKIVNVAPGTDKSDVATVGQLTKVISSNGTVTIAPVYKDQDGAPVYDLSVTGVPGADPRVDQLAEEIGRVGAQGAALSALKPIQYDPLEPTQIMAGYGNYRGNSAVALGVAHYKNESTLIHGGVSWAGGSSHMMANAGVTWKVGNRDSEAAVADRYRKGPISSAYAMQQEMAAMKAQNAGLKGEVSDLKAENEQMKAQIAAMMAKLGL